MRVAEGARIREGESREEKLGKLRKNVRSAVISSKNGVQ